MYICMYISVCVFVSMPLTHVHCNEKARTCESDPEAAINIAQPLLRQLLSLLSDTDVN